MAKPPADLPADGVVATFAYLGLRGRHSGSSTSAGDGGAGFGISQPRQQQHRATGGARVRVGDASTLSGASSSSTVAARREFRAARRCGVAAGRLTTAGGYCMRRSRVRGP